MTNEELVTLIQAGERDRLAELWEQVEKFVAMKARQRMTFSCGAGGVEFDDLYNCGYLALVAATDTYNVTAACSFISWLSLSLKTAFAEAGGYRSKRQAHDPLHCAGSLDAPVGDDTDGATLGDLQADPTAAQDFQNAEDRLFLEQLHDALEKAMDQLPTQHGDTLRRRFYQQQTLDEIAADEGVSKEAVRQWQSKGLQALRQEAELQQFVEDRTPYYMNASAKSGERTVERIVIRREQLVEQRTPKRLDRDRLVKIAADVGADYINAIEDISVRLYFRLRFLHGMNWKEVAALTGKRTGAAVRDACLRYLDAHYVCE
ncbi:MAG: sigma-70 family RNA polymerase sigma factor [Oscillospiraceae bacterium]|nr:sigma-70 family RNA polymerase sigma factor [Oscillospiraceae bacterium]